MTSFVAQFCTDRIEFVERDDRRMCFVMVGLPGVGKSTTIAEILKHAADSESIAPFKISVLSTDDIIEQHAKKHALTYTQAFNALDQKLVAKQFAAHLEACIANKHHLIVDQTNVTCKTRNAKVRRIEQLAGKGVYSFCVINVTADAHTIAKRVSEREKATGKHIPVSVSQHMAVNLTLRQPDDLIQRWVTIDTSD